jgi:TfoX/Sxy family transcriptional regulator of competence genes
MAYDEVLADRLRSVLEPEAGVSEKKMFGGLAFLVHGHMAVSVSGQGGLMLRVEPAQTGSVVQAEGVARVEMRGRAMDGWVRVDPSVVSSDDELARWAQVGVAYARSLPPT